MSDEVLDLDGAFDLMRQTRGPEALGDLVEATCPDSTPWRGRDGLFELDPADLFDQDYDLDEWVADAVREALDDRRDLEAYGKPYSEATRGMDAGEALAALSDDVTWQLMGRYRDMAYGDTDSSWRLGERDALEEALGREVDLSGASLGEMLDRLDEAGLATWVLPDVAEVGVPCDVMLGQPDEGLGAWDLYRLLCSREATPSDFDTEDLEATPLLRFAEQQGHTVEDVLMATEGFDVTSQEAADFDGGTFCSNLVEDVANATAAGWGNYVAFPCTLTCAQAVGLTHAGDALALGTDQVNLKVAWLGSFDPYMGAGGTMGLTLERDLVVLPEGETREGGLAVGRLLAVDPAHSSFLDGRPYSIGCVYDAVPEVYEASLGEARGMPSVARAEAVGRPSSLVASSELLEGARDADLSGGHRGAGTVSRTLRGGIS